jgi:hypothetical protein
MVEYLQLTRFHFLSLPFFTLPPPSSTCRAAKAEAANAADREKDANAAAKKAKVRIEE